MFGKQLDRTKERLKIIYKPCEIENRNTNWSKKEKKILSCVQKKGK